MPPFENFHRWLKGSFVCKRCGKEVYALFFGYGKTICPDCYDGEQSFIFFDGRYWLNRITAHLLKQRVCAYQNCPHPIQHP